ncbi:MAG: HPt (histidine-containing phosphotransfer) domain-containing protein [Roseivirga sp.]|jgi:HPt (histidine-containing phosphotransfer) domain-containing protein
MLSKRITQLTSKDVTLKIDLSLLEITVGGDKSFMRELLDTIYQTLPLELELLTVALEANDSEVSRKILHKIRPSIDYLGIPELSGQREELHRRAESNESNATLLTTFSSFKNQVTLALRQLKAYL